MTAADNISADITEEDIALATTANRAILQERFPDFDLSIGGPIDSLLVNGNVAVTARNNADVDRAYLYQQLQAISLGEVTVDDADLDRLMANYFLTRNLAQVATGDVRVVVSDNLVQTFSAGSVIFYSGLQYQLEQTFNVFPSTATGIDFTQPTNIQKQEVYDTETGYQYQFVLPVSSILADPTAVRVVGDRFTAGSGFAFSTLGYIEASTNFSGGVAAETNQQFAARGLQGLLAKTVGGNDHINALVASTVQMGNAFSLGANNAMMTRDRDNVFNISTGGKVDTYFKAGAITTQGFGVDAVVVDDVLRTIRITLTREQSAGVYRVQLLPIYLSAPSTSMTGVLEIDVISHDIWLDLTPNAFNPTMPQPIDRAFSSRQQIVLDITDDRQVGMTYVVDMSGGPGTILSGFYQIVTQYQAQLIEIDNVLLGNENRPPGVDILTKAAVPCVTTVGIVAQTPTNYNGPDAATISAYVASLINQLPITTAVLDASVISGLLRSINDTLVLQSVTLNGTIYGQDDVDLSIPQVAGRLTIPFNTTAKVSPQNSYFTTNANLVTVALV